MVNIDALFKVSYGLYIVCSGDKTKGNGYISNTVFQVTAEPAKFATCCNKNNYTAQLIKKHKCFSVSVLEKDASADIIGRFGYKSGKDNDKLDGVNLQYGITGTPIVENESVAFLEFKVLETIDVGTHLMFIGELEQAQILDNSKEVLTYDHYRNVRKGVAPKNAPTYVDKSKTKADAPEGKKYKCTACGYIYDEAEEPEKFEDLPEDWTCPVCGVDKDSFEEVI